MRLKIAALILFWFGVVIQSILFASYVQEIILHKTLLGLSFVGFFAGITLEMYLIYILFIHVAHIVGGYLLSKGKKIGAAAGIAVAAWEIVPFLTWDINLILGNAFGISLRILFAFVIFLIILGRKDLDKLQIENWRPWKNPIEKKLN